MTIKIFIGNLSGDTQADDVRVLFEKYGTVVECDVLKNYGFVHMNDKGEANTAIANLDGYYIKGQRMRVELSTGKKGNPKGDRRGGGGDRGGGRTRPYPPGPRRGGMPPPAYERYDPYYSRYPYPDRDPYYRMPPGDPYMGRRMPPPGDRYDSLPLPRDRMMPGERGAYPPPDPRDRLMPRDRLPPFPEDRAAYDRLRAADRAPMATDPYYRERSPPAARPPPEYYDRKPALMRTPGAGADPAAARLNTTAYPPANGYDFYRRPAATAERSDYGTGATNQDYYASSRTAAGAYDRPGAAAGTNSANPGGYGMTQQAQSKPYDSQSALQTQPIFF